VRVDFGRRLGFSVNVSSLQSIERILETERNRLTRREKLQAHKDVSGGGCARVNFGCGLGFGVNAQSTIDYLGEIV
jgi:hypothetical protein